MKGRTHTHPFIISMLHLSQPLKKYLFSFLLLIVFCSLQQQTTNFFFFLRICEVMLDVREAEKAAVQHEFEEKISFYLKISIRHYSYHCYC